MPPKSGKPPKISYFAMGNKIYSGTQNPISSTLFRKQTLEPWACKVKTLKLQLLKNLSIKIYKILDLCSPNTRQKSIGICFILHAGTFFLSSQLPRGTVKCICRMKSKIYHRVPKSL